MSEGLKEAHTGYKPVKSSKEKLEPPPKPIKLKTGLDAFIVEKGQSSLFEEPKIYKNTKEKLGNATWEVLHSSVAGMSDPPTGKQLDAFRDIVAGLQQIYPCVECKLGFDYKLSNPMQVGTRAELEQWVCEWHNEINRRQGKPAYRCENVHQAYELADCKTCMRTMNDYSEIIRFDESRVPLTDPRAQAYAKAIIEESCSRYGVPAPKIRFGNEVCPLPTACTTMVPGREATTSTINFDPSRFSLRTIYHENYHYLSSVLPKERIRKLLGDSFTGNPDDEDEADKFAYHEIEMFRSGSAKIQLNMQEGFATSSKPAMQQELLLEKPKEEVKVMNDAVSAITSDPIAPIFARLDSAYNWLSQISNLPAAELNQIWTPIVAGTLVDTGYGFIATPLGQLLLDLVTGAGLWAGGTSTRFSAGDRHVLQAWASYHLTRILQALNPHYLHSLATSGRALGQAVASGNGNAVLMQVVRNPNEIASGFRAAMQQLQAALKVEGGFPGRGFPFFANMVGGGAGGRVNPGGATTGHAIQNSGPSGNSGGQATANFGFN